MMTREHTLIKTSPTSRTISTVSFDMLLLSMYKLLICILSVEIPLLKVGLLELFNELVAVDVVGGDLCSKRLVYPIFR